MRTVPFMVANWLLLITPVIALDVPSVAKVYEPILIKHNAGAKVQVLPWGTPVPQFLDEKHLVRFDDHTVFCAPVGSYLVSGDGQLAIVLIQNGTDPDNPDPPKPDDPDVPPSPSDDCSKVPEDSFGNIGKLACQTLKTVPQDVRQRTQTKIKQAYLNTAKALDNPSSGVLTLDDATEYLRNELTAQLGSDKDKWLSWATTIGSHILTLQINRGNYADLCRSIAGGL